MTKEFNLSEEIILSKDVLGKYGEVLLVEDVKEALNLIKEEIILKSPNIRRNLIKFKEIVGDKLI